METRARFRAAREAGLQWVRLVPDKWKGAGRDFLLGNADDFTGIGCSFGGGMVNVCVSYKTIPALTFSVARGGDWIDSNAANVLGMPSSKATFIKESGMDIRNPKGREEEAIAIYYRNLISYTLTNIKNRFQMGKDMPSFNEPVDIVCAGGTSMSVELPLAR